MPFMPIMQNMGEHVGEVNDPTWSKKNPQKTDNKSVLGYFL